MQILCAVLILAACFISKILVLVAGIASLAYIFSKAKWEQKFAFFMFILSFSPIFKFNKDQTSLFMFLRIGIILSYMFQYREKFSFKFITSLIAFFAYGFIVSELNGNDYLVQLINFMIWIMVGYIIVNTLKSSDLTPVIRSLTIGIFITGTIGFFINEIPVLKEEIGMLSTFAEDGAIVYRYAAFWKDPNYFTILLIVAIWCYYIEYNKKRVNNVEFALSAFYLSFIGLMTMSKSCTILLLIFWLYVITTKNDVSTTSKTALVFGMIIAAIVFLQKNPYWISDIFYRFGSDKESITLSTVTTGRNDLWTHYLKNIFADYSWIFGNGVNAELLEINGEPKGSHNMYIEILYTLGAVGSAIYVWVFYNMYQNAKKRFDVKIYSRKSGPEKNLIIAILMTMFFLNGLYNEVYYYLLPLSLVCMIDNSSRNENHEEELVDE